MSISSIKEKKNTAQNIETIVSGMLPNSIESITRLSGGGNNQVYLIQCDGGIRFVSKFYYCNSNDQRDRMGVEYNSLLFLWGHGIENIPQPIKLNRDDACAVYRYIDGKAIIAQEVSDEDINEAVHFLGKLKSLRSEVSNVAIGPASEACFSAADLVNNIESRLKRFEGAKDESMQHDDLHTFLAREFKPAFKAITAWAQEQYKEEGFSFTEDISQEERILSPSDFGFHNARRSNEGRIVFLDFEYFGWDDPAKTISDFLLHPAMNLSNDQKGLFLGEVLKVFSNTENLKKRIKITYPFFGLKWCLIILNEFIPDDQKRRIFAGNEQESKEEILNRQLNKAKYMLEHVQLARKQFPYDI